MHYRGRHDEAADVVKRIVALGVDAIGVQSVLRESGTAEWLIDGAPSRWSRVDVAAAKAVYLLLRAAAKRSGAGSCFGNLAREARRNGQQCHRRPDR